MSSRLRGQCSWSTLGPAARSGRSARCEDPARLPGGGEQVPSGRHSRIESTIHPELACSTCVRMSVQSPRSAVASPSAKWTAKSAVGATTGSVVAAYSAGGIESSSTRAVSGGENAGSFSLSQAVSTGSVPPPKGRASPAIRMSRCWTKGTTSTGGCSGGHSSTGGTGGAGHACMTGPSCSPASSAVPIMTSASPWYSSDLVTALNPPRRMTSVKKRSGRASAGIRRDAYRDRGCSSGACVRACRSSRAASKPPCAPLHDHHVRSTGGSSTSLSARSSLFDTGSVLTHSMGRCVVAAGTVVVLRCTTADTRRA